MRKLVLLSTTTVLSLGIVGFTLSTPHQSTAFGPIQTNSFKTKKQFSIPIKQHLISTGDAKKLVGKFLGKYVASRMLHRVTHPLAKQRKGILFTTSATATTSSNWSGYDVQTTGATGVQGSFNVVSVSGSGADDAPWVGIGGVNGQNLAQTGVDLSMMQAWYEFYPQAPVFLFNVNPGDQMTGTVQYDSSTGNWLVDIQDLTTGQYYSNEFSFNPDQTTAEWIVEAPQSPVGSFNPINFTQSTWVDSSGTTHNVNSNSDNSLDQIYLNDPYGGSASPSAVGSNGQSFSITSH